MDLNKQNYYSNEADWQYMSVSQFKSFQECEAATLAKLKEEWSPESDPTALLVGKEAFEQGKLKIYEPQKNKKMEFGDYGVFAGELCKWTSFADVIKSQEVGTYVIACTEY